MEIKMNSYIELFSVFIILIWQFLYETSQKVRYYFKFLTYYVIISFNSMVLIPAFAFRPRDVRNLRWASILCHPISTLIGIKWELRGKEHLSKDQACIIVANHQSSLDILGMLEIYPIMNKCAIVAKRQLLYVWPFGWAAWLAGQIFVDRNSSKKDRDTLNVANQIVKSKGIKMWVFPEGTRRNTGEIHSFKKGAFHMAIDAQIPIMPVVFSSYCTFLNDNKRILNAGNIIITTLPMVSTTGMTKDDLPKLMELVHSQMTQTFKQTSAEILSRYKTTKNDESTPLNIFRTHNELELKTSDDILKEFGRKQLPLREAVKAQ